MRVYECVDIGTRFLIDGIPFLLINCIFVRVYVYLRLNNTHYALVYEYLCSLTRSSGSNT